MNILSLENVGKTFGIKPLFSSVTFGMEEGEKIGVIGANGSGKSTLLRVIAGEELPDTGRVVIAKGKLVATLSQNPVFDSDENILEAVFRGGNEALQSKLELIQRYEVACHDLAVQGGSSEKLLGQVSDLAHELEVAGAWQLEKEAKAILTELGIVDLSARMGRLSGGQRKRVALAHSLLIQPDLLILDEPTNHLDAETVDWLEIQLKEYPGTVIVVTHDRYFLDNITKWILELEGGAGIPWEGNYTSWLEQKLSKLSAEQKKNSPRARALDRELGWLKMSNNDRQAMARTRIMEYAQLIARETATLKDDASVIQIAPGPELGDKVVEFADVSKAYGDQVLFSSAGFSIPRNAVVGLVGPNGAGKTTLFKMIVGQEKPDSGKVEIGSTVKIAYVDQGRENLSTDVSLLDEVSGGAAEVILGKQSIPVRQYLSRFGFKGADQQKMAGELSGGERNRLHLAKLLKVGGNVLLLDEPTNDLDVNTLRMLEEAVLDFAGTVLVISHDRYFLDRICTHLLVFEGDGKLRWFVGNFKEYEELRIKETGGHQFENRRNRYRKLVRA